MEILTTKIEKEKSAIDEAVEILANSGVVAFPTETVYGLGCDYTDETALKKIFEVKGRSFNKPLTAHISKLEEIENLAEDIPNIFYRLADKFLPGPLSVILPKKNTVSDLMTSGLKTIAIRFPKNQTALNLISAYGKPLAATSANISGGISPLSAKEVLAELNSQIPLIIDDGETAEQKESTIISLVGQVEIIRQGAIPVEEIENILRRKLLIKS